MKMKWTFISISIGILCDVGLTAVLSGHLWPIDGFIFYLLAFWCLNTSLFVGPLFANLIDEAKLFQFLFSGALIEGLGGIGLIGPHLKLEYLPIIGLFAGCGALASGLGWGMGEVIHAWQYRSLRRRLAGKS